MTAANSPKKPPKLPSLGRLDDKYELLREIGSGGAGTVYEAEHLVVGKRVAIKVLNSLASRDETTRARLVGEARAAAQIGHENVIDIHDFGVSADGAPYLVMELLEGETLAELMERRGALPPTTACELVVQILAGLGAAHALGIVHRDLKPANIVVTHPRPDAPLLKILDFGIASGVQGGANPKSEELLGTPLYMAPEQALGKPVDERADIYAAGVILYEMLAGEVPFSGSRTEVLRAVSIGNFRPLSSVNPAVPRTLAAAVVAAMATEPEDRPRSAYAFAQRLSPYLSHAPPHSVPQGRHSADAFLLRDGTTGSEGPLLSDAPGGSRPPRDFPSFDLARIAGKPRGEPLSDSLLQRPIIPKAPAAAKIQLFDGTRDLESWSVAPERAEPEDAEPEGAAPSTREASKAGDSEFPYDAGVDADVEAAPSQGWIRPAWMTAVGVGVGAALAWLYRFS